MLTESKHKIKRKHESFDAKLTKSSFFDSLYKQGKTFFYKLIKHAEKVCKYLLRINFPS